MPIQGVGGEKGRLGGGGGPETYIVCSFVSCEALTDKCGTYLHFDRSSTIYVN